MWNATKKKSGLAYKQDDKQQAGQDGEDDEDELGMLEIFARIILFPFAVPVFMVYIYFYARGTPIASELDALDGEDSGSDTSSEAEVLTAYDRSNQFAKRVCKFLCCKADTASETAKSSVLSYDAFMEQQQKKNKKPSPKKKAHDNMPPYEVVTNVARTDRLEIEKDGVFVRNIFVPLTDVATLEQLLSEIETAALQEEESRGFEFDEWGHKTSVKGDTKAVIEELLAQAKKKQGIHMGDKSTSLPASPSKKTAGVGAEGRQNNGSPNKQSRSGVRDSPGTPGSSSKKKPRKAPHAEGTPLRDRMNMDAVLDRGAVVVDGPSIEVVPTGLLRAMP
jgi:hypothetical protein